MKRLTILPEDSHPWQGRTSCEPEIDGDTTRETLLRQWLRFSLWPLRAGRSFDQDAPGGDAPAEFRWSVELLTACHQGRYTSSFG